MKRCQIQEKNTNERAIGLQWEQQHRMHGVNGDIKRERKDDSTTCVLLYRECMVRK